MEKARLVTQMLARVGLKDNTMFLIYFFCPYKEKSQILCSCVFTLASILE